MLPVKEPGSQGRPGTRTRPAPRSRIFHNETDGSRERLKSPSAEVLSTAAPWETTPNDNLHTLATAALARSTSPRCQEWEELQRGVGSENSRVSRFLDVNPNH